MTSDSATGVGAQPRDGAPSEPESPATPRARRGGWGARDIALSVLLLVAVLAIWELISRTLLPPIILPAASDVAEGLWSLLTAPWFPQHVWTTVVEMLLGFGLACVLAVLLAAGLHFLPVVRRLLYPYVIFLHLTPSIVLAPIFLVWFGFGLTSKVALAAASAFFAILVSGLAGFDAVDRESIDFMRSMVASKRQIFFMLTVRTALPYLFAGLKTAVTVALIGALVAEFISARIGLGTLLTQFAFSLEQRLVFATVIVVALLGLVFFGLVTWLERKVVWWR